MFGDAIPEEAAALPWPQIGAGGKEGSGEK